MSILATFADVGLREDLTTLDLLGDKYTAAYNKAKKVKATSVHPEWLEDNLSDGNADNAAQQGATFTFSTTNARSRMENWTQIFTQLVGVSGSVNASKLANGADNASTTELAAQYEKAILQNTRDQDAAILKGTAVEPSAGVAGKMDGLTNLINAANKYDSAATALAYADIDAGITLIATAGAQPDCAFATAAIKAEIAALNRSAAPYQTVVIANGDADKKVMGASVAFQGTAGEIELFFDPRQATDKLTIVDSSRLQLAVLRNNDITNNINFDGIGRALITECAAKLTHSKAGAVMTKLASS